MELRKYTKTDLHLVERVLRCKNDDYYGLLQICTNATEKELKRAFKSQARLIHPDKNAAPGANEATQKLLKAYEKLTLVIKTATAKENYFNFGSQNNENQENNSYTFNKQNCSQSNNYNQEKSFSSANNKYSQSTDYSQQNYYSSTSQKYSQQSSSTTNSQNYSTSENSSQSNVNNEDKSSTSSSQNYSQNNGCSQQSSKSTFYNSKNTSYQRKKRRSNVTPEVLNIIQRILKCDPNDYHSILNVTKNATAEEITEAFKILIKQVHPEKIFAPGAFEAYTKISKAYKMLTKKIWQCTID